MSAAAPAASADQPEVTIVTEVPPSLDKALLLLVKNFYSGEHFLIVYYIMKAVCIKEDTLSKRLNFEQKQLRAQLASLRMEKLVKDRNVSSKGENNRTQSTIFYFINYRAIINVLKYKIDHMRQKLEAKEKEDVQKAMYKCEQCGALYETLEVDRILNPQTGLLQCWRCHGNVAPDETGGPTQVTRSLLAKFNEQMLPLFAVIRELAGVQLAPHLLEPDITKYMEEDKQEAAARMDNVDFSQPGNGRVQLGAKAFSNHKSAPTLRYAHGDQIIVDLNADSNAKVVEETKQVPAWLQDDAIVGGEHAQAVASLSSEQTADENRAEERPLVHSTSAVTMDMLMEMESEPVAKRTKVEKLEQEEGGSSQETAEEEDEDEEEDPMVTVQGVQVPITEVTPEQIAEMTDEEKAEYSRIFAELYAD